MYAIVEIAGKQFKVHKGQRLYTPKLQEKEGASVSFDKVLLIEDTDAITVGQPTVCGAQVTGTVTTHTQGDKIIVFKKKRRKGYRKKQGHRQDYTEVLIENIVK